MARGHFGPLPPETKAKIAAALRGRTHDHGHKIGDALRGRKRPEQSVLLRAQWADPASSFNNRRVTGECAYCGGTATTLDHVFPGWNRFVVPACMKCNASKGQRDAWEWLEAGLYGS